MLGARRKGVNHVSMNLDVFDRNAGPVRDIVYAGAAITAVASRTSGRVRRRDQQRDS